MINKYKYQIINPKRDKTKPLYDRLTGVLHFKLDKIYRFYVEASITQDDNKEFLLLMGFDKFDDNCKHCEKNMFGNYKIRLSNEIKTYVENELIHREYVNVEYKESEEGFDVYVIE